MYILYAHTYVHIYVLCFSLQIHRFPKKSLTLPTRTPTNIECSRIPFELKTGKMWNKLGSSEHRAQIILYTLMMKERYNVDVQGGLLHYLKGRHMQGIPAFPREKRGTRMCVWCTYFEVYECGFRLITDNKGLFTLVPIADPIRILYSRLVVSKELVDILHWETDVPHGFYPLIRVFSDFAMAPYE